MTTWVAKVNNVDDVAAEHINLLQTLKQDIDGEIALTGTDQWDKGVDVVAASPLLVLDDGNYFVVTGNTGITSIQASQSQPGTLIVLKFSGTPIITHHATNLILPGGANITAAAGDIAVFVHDDTGNKWRCVSYVKADGKSIIPPKLDDCGTPDDNTDLDSTTTEHGLLKKLSNDATQFLNGVGSWVTGAVFPEGMITSIVPGYFTDGSNGGYTFVLGAANTVAAMNTLLNSSGWYVCNGAALNLGASTIYNGAGRYLPNLTDDRFLMGDTLAGGIGGSNTMAHTHTFSDTHTHVDTFTTDNESTHKHIAPVSKDSAELAICDAYGTVSLSGDWVYVSQDSFNTYAADASYTSAGQAHNHGISGAVGNGTASGTTSAASNDENRPTYLSCFYIQYVLA